MKTRIVVWGLVAIAVIVVVYLRYPTFKMNRLVNEANKHVTAGDDKRKELDSDTDQFQLFMGRVPKTYFVKRDAHAPAGEKDFLSGTGPENTVLDRAKLEKTVANYSELLDQIAADFHAAAEKFDEASRAGRDEVVAKYYGIISQANQQRAKAAELRRKAVALLLDKSVKSQEDLTKQCGALMQDARKAEGEFDKLEFEAQKVRRANKGKFSESDS